jgi:coenzyme F420-reducing hydrogenase delta subunit
MPELKARHMQVLASLVDVLGLRIERAREQNDICEAERLEKQLDAYQRELEMLRSDSKIPDLLNKT